MTVGLTRVDAPGGGIVVNARRTHPELIAPAPGGPRHKAMDGSRSQRDTPRTTPTDFSRRDSAMPILSCPGDKTPDDGAAVTLSTDRPASDDALRRELAAGWPRWGERNRAREALLQAHHRRLLLVGLDEAPAKASGR